SNSKRPFVEKILNDHKLTPQVLVTAEDVIRPKPAPDLFWHCANLLGIPPQNRASIFVFEDTKHGIAAAIAAGMHPIGIATDIDKEHLLRAGAEHAFEDFGSLDLIF